MSSRKKSTRAAPGKPPGGPRRSGSEVANIQNQVETLMLYGVSGPEILKALAKAGVELSERTLDDYCRRVREGWTREAAAARTTARERQLNRLYAQVRELQLAKDHDEVHKREKLIARIEGNLAPVTVEVVEKSTWEDLTPEQLKYISDNGGKLPPGVTAEQLRTRG